MAPRFHPQLVNDPFGDPGLYIEFQFEKRSILFDLGELNRLPPRKLVRVSDVFVSHMHMDHFSGFDRLLRVMLGRDHTLRLFGPEGLVAAVSHKLAAYTWNLVETYAANLTLVVSEFPGDGTLRTVAFACRDRFRPSAERIRRVENGRLLAEQSLGVRTVVLDHGIPCLAFALEEQAHVNIWKNRLEQMGLRVGPWLRDLKQAIVRGDPDNAPVTARWQEDGTQRERTLPLGLLRGEVAVIAPGSKIVYVVDAAPTDSNLAAIRSLAADATILFIETPFLHEDLERARTRRHLTARLAGGVARAAAVQRLVTLHYSPRYEDRAEELVREAETAFACR